MLCAIGPCLRYPSVELGVWTYEICLGRWVRQWHANVNVNSDQTSTPLGSSSRILGTLHSEYAWRQDWAYYLNASRELSRHDASHAATDTTILRPAPENDDTDPTFEAHSPALELPPEVLYQFHSQLYANGTRCEPSGRQFETVLRVCSMTWIFRLVSSKRTLIEQYCTVQYIFVFSSLFR